VIFIDGAGSGHRKSTQLVQSEEKGKQQPNIKTNVQSQKESTSVSSFITPRVKLEVQGDAKDRKQKAYSTI
jgi:hypothetical protein